MAIKYNKIETKIEALIKAKIKEKGLVSSGKMYDSIKVVSSNGGFNVQAVDYFQYLDSKHHILDEVFASQAFIDLLVEEAGNQIGDDLLKDF
jgi:hypothetical protein